MLAAFEEAEAAVGPVYDVRGVLDDPQYQALGTALTVDDPDLGPLRDAERAVPAVRRRPAQCAGPAALHGADTDEVLARARPVRRGDRRARARRARYEHRSTASTSPASRPDRFDEGRGHRRRVVILDLEDAVAAADKARARADVAAWLATYDGSVQVRVNAPGTGDLAADLAALAPSVDLRLPKIGSPADLDAVAGRRVHAILESAAGVEAALEIGRRAEVVSLTLGEADLAAELGLDGEDAFDWVRSRLVVAAAAAGLPAPMMSAYPAVRDLDGLAASCARGRRLGMRGRTAVHPSQVPVIREAFAPTEAEAAWANEVLAALERAGVATLVDGSMVDAAMARRARSILG